MTSFFKSSLLRSLLCNWLPPLFDRTTGQTQRSRLLRRRSFRLESLEERLALSVTMASTYRAMTMTMTGDFVGTRDRTDGSFKQHFTVPSANAAGTLAFTSATQGSGTLYLSGSKASAGYDGRQEIYSHGSWQPVEYFNIAPQSYWGGQFVNVIVNDPKLNMNGMRVSQWLLDPTTGKVDDFGSTLIVEPAATNGGSFNPSTFKANIDFSHPYVAGGTTKRYYTVTGKIAGTVVDKATTSTDLVASYKALTGGSLEFNVNVTGKFMKTPAMGTAVTDAHLYWSTNTNLSGKISEVNLGAMNVFWNTGSLKVTTSALSGAPAGAKYLVFAVDPNAKVAEASELNNLAAVAISTAPVLNAGKSPALAAISEDAAAPVGAVGTLVSKLVDVGGPLRNVTDINASALTGIAVTAAATTNGTWYYSTNGGSTWSALGAVSGTSARLLAADAATRLYFKPNANYNGTQTTALTFQAWDRTNGVVNGGLANASIAGGATAFSTATDTASLTIAAVNDAPVLNAAKSPALTAVIEDAAAPVGAVGTLVSALVDFASPAGQRDNVTDVDSTLLGIAITVASTTNGAWYYSLNNGVAWNALGVSSASARLLAADANSRLHFKPTANYSGTQTLTFRAWDRTSGANGGSVNISASNSVGGATAFSAATDTASLTVTAVNDAAPLLDAAKSPSLNGILANAGLPSGAVGTLVSALVDFASPAGQVDNVTDIDSGALLGIAVTAAATTNGTWYYSLNNGSTWAALGAVSNSSARLLAADAATRLYFQPNPGYRGMQPTALTFRAWDRTSGVNGGSVNISAITSVGGTTAFSTATDTAWLSVI